jgi:hypothetical protein
LTKGLPLIGSLALNFLLALWLINNYFYDQPFRNYVDLTLGQIGPYLILTIGVGGGSSLGYVFLKRKHPGEQGITSKLPKSRFPRPGLLTSQSSGPSQTAKGMPSGAAPSQIPKHVAYAVPPAISSKSSSPGMSKQGTPTSSWSASSKPSSSHQLGSSQSQPQLLRREVPTLSSSSVSQMKTESSPTTIVPRQAPTPWRPESQPSDRNPDLNRPMPKPGTDFQTRPQSTVPPQQQNPRPLQATSEQSSPGTVLPPVPQKWQPQNQPGFTQPLPPQTSGQQQRQDVDPSQKWQSVRPFGQQQTSPVPSPQPRQFPPGPNPPQGNPMRPPPGPFTARPLPPGAPRPPPPYQQMPGQGQTRPGALAPVGVPRQFRPDSGPPQQSAQNQPRPIIPNQWAPPQGGGPAPSIDRPSPSPRTQPMDQQQLRREQISQKPPEQTTTSSEIGQSSAEPAPGAGGSDMDWDTALDTILKTLRRDRIRDEQ